jgi:RND family efflux transporter MFP subunit
MKKMNFFKMLLASAVVVSAVACKNGAKEETAASSAMEKEAAVQVKTKQCFDREVEQIETFTATVEANVKNNISSKMPLRISNIYVEVGDRVNKGQKLASMEAINLTQARLQMQNDSLEFVRTDNLYKAGGVSQSVWDVRKMAYSISRESYMNLLENTVLVSPISGIVTARNYDKGDMFNMGAPLFVVEEIRPVKLKINVSEQLFTYVKKGMTVDVKLDVYGDEVFKGVVSLVYPTIDPATRTFPVEVKMQNANEKVRPGMFARVTMAYGNANHVVVPDMAVVKLSGSGDRFVYVVEDNKVVFKKVELGRRFETEYEIVSGLKSGDEVVVEGHSRLTNGASVEIIK